MSESKSDATPRVARPVLAPFRGPIGAHPPVALRPPTPPNGRDTLPPFGAIRQGGPLPGVASRRSVEVYAAVVEEPHRAPSYDEVLHEAAIVAAAEPDAEPDGWYDGAETEPVVEPVAQAMTEPAREAFESATKDLPLYMPTNVDVSRWTPRSNRVIPSEPNPAFHQAPVTRPAAPPPSYEEPTPEAAAAEWAAFVGATPVDETPTREWRSPPLTPAFTTAPTPTRAVTPVMPVDAIEANDSVAESSGAPHRMTPMRVTPIMARPVRATPVMGMRTPIRPQSPVDGSEVIGVVPTAGNRVVAAALESVAAQVRRGALVVSGAIPEGDDSHSLAAALAAALGALLGVSR
ncbi:MAG TPA: hypothetical protein VNW46_05365 [Gemmatimonadaceae bacterium]|jgi:hypothetical protein|nr:hypothetical protein [Gemmatimonadaceae bacterium]